MQQGLLEALELHTDYRPDCKTTISRLELGKAWPNLEIVRALATLDATLDGGGGRGLLYWGWGLSEDPFRFRKPGPTLGVDGLPERELERLEPPTQRRARRAR